MFRERPQYIAVARCIQIGRQSHARRHFSVREHRPRLTEHIVGPAVGVAGLRLESRQGKRNPRHAGLNSPLGRYPGVDLVAGNGHQSFLRIAIPVRVGAAIVA
jgi:hypothetical protein